VINIRQQLANAKFGVKLVENIERIKSRRDPSRVRKEGACEELTSKSQTSNSNLCRGV
jgi:hypothetical protein